VSGPSTESRPYGGVSSEERRARRHEQLLAAGLELFGTRGFKASSVREICLAASLNRRYFYESFNTREDLLRAVYDDLVVELAQQTLAAVDAADESFEARMRAGMTAFWEWITADERRARILCIEIIGVSEELEQRRRDARHAFADFIAAQGRELMEASGRQTRVDITLAARTLVSSALDLVIDWMRDDIHLTVPELIDESIRFYTASMRGVLESVD
jgi:AcrR family transcriptional regulator